MRKGVALRGNLDATLNEVDVSAQRKQNAAAPNSRGACWVSMNSPTFVQKVGRPQMHKACLSAGHSLPTTAPTAQLGGSSVAQRHSCSKPAREAAASAQIQQMYAPSAPTSAAAAALPPCAPSAGVRGRALPSPAAFAMWCTVSWVKGRPGSPVAAQGRQRSTVAAGYCSAGASRTLTYGQPRAAAASSSSIPSPEVRAGTTAGVGAGAGGAGGGTVRREMADAGSTKQHNWPCSPPSAIRSSHPLLLGPSIAADPTPTSTPSIQPRPTRPKARQPGAYGWAGGRPHLLTDGNVGAVGPKPLPDEFKTVLLAAVAGAPHML